jgi:uncharacterized protein (TIGR02001 family)
LPFGNSAVRIYPRSPMVLASFTGCMIFLPRVSQTGESGWRIGALRMKRGTRVSWLMAAAAAVALGGLADRAAAADAAADADTAAMFDVAFGVAVTSDYISRGITQTDHKAAIQGYIEPSYGIVYGGLWASNVSFVGEKDTEVDAYAGIRPEFGKLSLDFGYVRYLYSDSSSGEAYAKGKFSLTDNVALGAQFFIDPDSSATYTEANVDLSLPHNFGISGAVGFVHNDFMPYTTWNAGIYYQATDWAKLDLRYSATDLSEADCVTATDGGIGNECDGRLLLTLSIDTAISSLKGE